MTQENKTRIHSVFKTLEDRIKEFCQPLYNEGIEFFSYTRIYKDNTFLFLSNNDDLFKLKLEKELFNYNDFVCLSHLNSHTYTKYIHTGDLCKISRFFPEIYALRNWNSIDYYYNNEKFIEVSHFGGTIEKTHLVNFYLNNSLFLEMMICSFRYQFANVLEPPDKSLLIPLNDKIPDNISPLPIETSSLLSSQKKIPFTYKDKTYLLSKRQVQCLGLTLKGKTAKEIGKEICLSYRTIEDYIKNLKNKLGCSTKGALLSSLTSSQVSYLLSFIDSLDPFCIM